MQQENNFQNARSLKSLWITVSSKKQVSYIILEHGWTNIYEKKTDYHQVCYSYVQHPMYKAYTKHSNKSACQTLIQGLVIAHLDYANALYFRLPDIDVKKLQGVQNIAARLILRKQIETASQNVLESYIGSLLELRLTSKSWCLYTSACKEIHQTTSRN